MDMPKVYILILNWNGWKDTVECLESVQRLDYQNYKLVLVDNDSSNGSVEKIYEWARGDLEVESKFIQYNRDNKPLKVIQYTKNEAESGGDIDQENELISIRPDRRLVIIQAGANRGFAGGNNVGINYILAQGDADYIWLLNNDTIVESNSLSQLVNRMKNDKTVGICGSSILYYHRPDIIQALGGKYNKYLGLSKHIGARTNIRILNKLSQQDIESQIDYVVGASMLVSIDFIDDIGLMCEDYFLYFEELDWIKRARGKYRLGYAKNSIVYHKEGSSTGSNIKELSSKADYYSIRNRITFTTRFYPLYLPLVYLGLFGAIINRIRRRQWGRAKMILCIIFCNKRVSYSGSNKPTTDVRNS